MAAAKLVAGVVIFVLGGSPVRSEPSCNDLQKYLTGGQSEFARNRGERRADENRWTSRNPILGGACEIVATFNPSEFKTNCTFNAGGRDVERLAAYQFQSNFVQTCLNGMDSRDDWRKRDTSRAEFGGRAIAETTWTWTQLRNGIERQIIVSNDPGDPDGPDKGRNLLVVIWRERQRN